MLTFYGCCAKLNFYFNWCLNMNLLNAIVSYKDCFYYIDKLYKTNGVYNGVVRIRSIEDNSITIRIMFKALTKVSN